MSVIPDTALDIAYLLTLLGLVTASIRLFLGPSRADRIVALDLITVLLVAIASLSALRFDDAAYLDLGLTLALVGFLATVAFARYVDREPTLDPTAPRRPVASDAEAANATSPDDASTMVGGTHDTTARGAPSGSAGSGAAGSANAGSATAPGRRS